MNVGDLQHHLAELRRLFEVSGAKQAVVSELAAVRDALAPFRDLPLKQFADFLVRAEGYRARGEVAEKPPRGGRSGGRAAGGATKATQVDLGALAAEVKGVYERAADPSVTAEQIEGLAGRLSAISKEGLVAVAEAIELKGMKSKAKGPLLEAIKHRLLARKGSAIRSTLIDRPATTNGPPDLPPGDGVESESAVGGPARPTG